jgi:hypothetical protein
MRGMLLGAQMLKAAILLLCLQLGNAYYLPGTYPKVRINT